MNHSRRGTAPRPPERSLVLTRSAVTVTVTAAIALPLLLLLSACGTGTPIADPPAPDSPSAEPTEAPIEVSLAPDALLGVHVRATASNGATALLELTVHESLAWSDPAAAQLADRMSESCDGALENAVYEENLWSFTRITYTASEVEGAWPADAAIHLAPTDPQGGIAGTGAVTDDQNVDMATPFCLRGKYLAVPGEGAIALGIPGDTDEVTAAGNFTRWANTSYGFDVFDTPGGVTLSDCTYEVPELGLQHNAENESWELISTDTVCTVGAPFTGED